MDMYEEQMKNHRPICFIMVDFMKVLYTILVYIMPSSGISEHKRTELINEMNKLFTEMIYYTERND